ncbi:hypothetical protein PAEPH01_0854 [Pancytospora epiphaga]|nr:hypothetical protein PAEPH01_0854 [Pancytospora epiphaga]
MLMGMSVCKTRHDTATYMLGRETGTCSHCKKCLKTADHLATHCDKMRYHSYTSRDNKVVRCIHLWFL